MLGRLVRRWLAREPGGVPVPGMPQGSDLPEDLAPGLRAQLVLACAAAAQGRARDAAQALRRACKDWPAHPLPWALAARLAAVTGAPDAAEMAARAGILDAAVPADDRVAQYFYARGMLAINASDDRTAVRCLEFAEFLLPGAYPPLEMLGIAGYLSGDIERGRACFDRAIELGGAGESGRLRLSRLIHTIPQIYASARHLAGERAWFESELAALEAEPPRGIPPMVAMRVTCFYLTYQGLNNRALNMRIARLLLQISPDLGYVAPHAAGRDWPRPAKLAVAVVSAHLGRHSVGHWYRAFVRRLIECGRFDVTLFSSSDDLDARLLAAAGPRLVVLPQELEGARAAIEARRPDVLVHTDVGMHPFYYLLAFSRLAPVQALLVGHPETSGIPAIDYFVSNVHQDDAPAQEHYSERLVRLSRIPVMVERTAAPDETLSRADLGMADGVRYYVCPMMLQKMHPDFDGAIADILRRDEAGELVLFADVRRTLWQTRLEERFAASMPDVAGRIVFRPYAPRGEFLNVLMAADCVLDPFHFSGGVTTHIALSLGVPVVTLAGELFRSRMTAGIYAQAGIEGLTAATPGEFVELALAMARDPARRAEAGRRIRVAHPEIFDTVAAVDEFADWLEHTGRASPREACGTTAFAVRPPDGDAR